MQYFAVWQFCEVLIKVKFEVGDCFVLSIYSPIILSLPKSLDIVDH